MKKLMPQRIKEFYEIGPVQRAAVDDLIDAVRQDEREACAKLCDHWASYGAPAAEACAESIRERGDKHDSNK